MNNLEEILRSLSDDQRDIYEALNAGKTIEQISNETGRPPGIIQAQRTRILNKGISLPDLATIANPARTRDSAESQRPASASRSSVESVISDVAGAGTAKYDVEELVKRVQATGDGNQNVRDVHPMVLLGVTIQFMKLAGGRMHAHQLIEDVYGALSSMADGRRLPDVPGVTTETKPWPPQQSNIVPGNSETLEAAKMFGQLQEQMAAIAAKMGIGR